MDAPTSTPRPLPEGIEIRGSRHDDVDGFLDLVTEVAGEGRFIGRELPLDREVRAAAFAAGIEHPQRLSLVAVRDDRVVGNLGLDHDGSGNAELGMMLSADVRGAGLGSALLAEAISWADAHPVVHKVNLQVWPHNVAALALYRRFGFSVEGYRHRHWRRNDGQLWDAVLMGLLVTDRTGFDPHPPPT